MNLIFWLTKILNYINESSRLCQGDTRVECGRKKEPDPGHADYPETCI